MTPKILKILIAGPCVGEHSENWIVEQAGAIAAQLQSPATSSRYLWIFKCSFDKANRTDAGSHRGLGLDVTLRAFERIKQMYGCPVTTDIHEVWQAHELRETVDVVQLPAMLCRQTDLIHAAGNNALNCINIKCGTGASADEMVRAADKSNKPAWLTYRGTSIANRLFFLPEQVLNLQDAYSGEILVDVTHTARDEERNHNMPWCEMSMVAAKCAAAIDADGLFLECHPDPERALSDSNMQINIDNLYEFLGEL